MLSFDSFVVLQECTLLTYIVVIRLAIVTLQLCKDEEKYKPCLLSNLHTPEACTINKVQHTHVSVIWFHYP